MPVLVTVGRSKKVSENYNSDGFSLNVQAELPASVLEDPNALAEQTNMLFQLTTDLLDEQVRIAGNNNTVSQPVSVPASQPRQAYQAKGGNGNRGITDAQKNAIQKMAAKVGDNPEALAHSGYNVGLDQLSIKQASALIDDLKVRIEGPKQEVPV